MTRQEIINFIKENYTNIGLKKCTEICNCKKYVIQNIAVKLNLQVDRSIYRKNNVDLTKFENMTDPKIAYFLGVFFADGFIRSDKKGLGFSIASQDFVEIKHIFDNIKTVSVKLRNRKESWKECASVYIFDRTFVEFAEKHGFKDNSFDKVLKLVPKNLLRYFLRGLFDGDGCWFLKKYNKAIIKTVSISGPYDFNWNILENILNEFNIHFQYKQVISKKGHRHSVIDIRHIADILKFGLFVYDDYPLNKMGLSRKYEKFLEMMDWEIKRLEKDKEKNIKFYKKSLFVVILKYQNFKKRIIGIKTIEEAILIRESILKNEAPEYYRYEAILEPLQTYTDFLLLDSLNSQTSSIDTIEVPLLVAANEAA